MSRSYDVTREHKQQGFVSPIEERVDMYKQMMAAEQTREILATVDTKVDTKEHTKMSDRDTMNLWEETLEDLKCYDKTWSDVEWVGTSEFKISKENFETLAKKTNYDAGYGWQEVAKDLIIAGDNWCLRRAEYDGSESWEFVDMLREPEEERLVDYLAIHEGHSGWESLSELNNEEDSNEDN